MLKAQYTFIHDALEELITCGDTSFNVQSMHVKSNDQGKSRNRNNQFPGTVSGIYVAMWLNNLYGCDVDLLVTRQSLQPTLNDCADSQHASNKAKN